MKKVILVFLICTTACSSNLDYNEANERNNKQMTTEETRGDARFLVEAKSASLLFLRLGELAAGKGYSSAVQSYANKLVNDHERLNDQLEEVAKNQKIKLPQDMSGSHKMLLKDLEDATREDFDRRFIRTTERLYEDVINMHKDVATSGFNDDVRAFAAKTLGMLRNNEQRADELEDQLL